MIYPCDKCDKYKGGEDYDKANCIRYTKCKIWKAWFKSEWNNVCEALRELKNEL